jgi:hypothetical protein
MVDLHEKKNEKEKNNQEIEKEENGERNDHIA